MQAETTSALTISVSLLAVLPIVAVYIPLVGALIVAFVGKREKIRDLTALVTPVITTALIASMYKPVVDGIRIGGHFYKGLEFTVPVLLQSGVGFKVDAIGFIFALITGIIWSFSIIYSLSYMANERAKTSYYVFCLLTLSANLGVLLTKDFFSLYLFFEALAFFSYMLFIHRRDEKSLAAGRLYLYLSIIGGLFLLMGILLLYKYAGTMNIQPIGKLLSGAIPQYIKYLIVALMTIGFGVKAGIFFLHVWIPETYPPAPTPVCALSSGAMIKAGTYGILRTVNTLFAPTIILAVSQFTLSSIGYVVIWIGIITMLGGMINALFSKDCKRLLAYSSVSQMGYIVLGLGIAAYLGRDGAMGMAGSLYHIINHAFFKSALFLSIGVVYFRTRELDMEKLGGLWRNMPLTALVCLFAALSIAGVPGFGGFASKAILHQAIIEAYIRSAALPPFHRPDIFLRIAEILFLITAFGTFCYSMKLFISVFLLKRPEEYKDVTPETLPMKIALLPLAAFTLWIGLRPNFILEKLIGPALSYFSYNPDSYSYRILYNIQAVPGALRSTIPILYDPRAFSIFGNPTVLSNLLMAGVEILGGSLLFVFGYRFGFFDFKAPEWMGVKFWYLKIAEGFLELLQIIMVVKKKLSSILLLFIGSSALRDQRAWDLKQTWIKETLEDEKISTVREAVRKSNISMIRKRAPYDYRQRRVAEIRENVGRDALKIMQLKMSIFKEATRALEKAEIPISERPQKLSEIMRPISETAQRAGAQGLDDLRAAIKSFSENVQLNPQLKKGNIILNIIGGELEKRMISRVETEKKWKELIEYYKKAEVGEVRAKETSYQKFVKWMSNMLRILAEITAAGRLPWTPEKRLSQNQIDETRDSIRVYTRDMSINVVVVVGLFVLIAIALFFKLFLKIY